MTANLSLTGCLGKDRDLRETRPQTKVVAVWNPVAEMTEEFDVTIPPREYLRLSLAVRERGRTGWETRWLELIAWDLHRTEIAGIRLCRAGDRIAITGREETFTYTDRDGSERTFRYISIATFRFLRHKIRREVE